MAPPFESSGHAVRRSAFSLLSFSLHPCVLIHSISVQADQLAVAQSMTVHQMCHSLTTIRQGQQLRAGRSLNDAEVHMNSDQFLLTGYFNAPRAKLSPLPCGLKTAKVVLEPMVICFCAIDGFEAMKACAALPLLHSCVCIYKAVAVQSMRMSLLCACRMTASGLALFEALSLHILPVLQHRQMSLDICTATCRASLCSAAYW